MKNKLVEVKLSECAEWMEQIVVEAGGCLHVVRFKDGQFVFHGGRHAAPIRGVTRAWCLA
jgi:hypothetical protein